MSVHARPDIEYRSLPVALSVDQAPDVGGAGPTITGRAIVYGSLSEDLGGYREVIAPGAVTFAPDVLALFDHNTSQVIGRTSSGTLEVADDGQGVTVKMTPPDTTWARDLLTSMRRGDIKQMSFGFRVRDCQWYEEAGQPRRLLTDIYVLELSAVAMPAYSDTTCEAT